MNEFGVQVGMRCELLDVLPGDAFGSDSSVMQTVSFEWSLVDEVEIGIAAFYEDSRTSVALNELQLFGGLVS